MNLQTITDCPPVLKDFIFYIETIKGKSPKTVYEYYLDIRMFLRFTKRNKGLVPPDINMDEILIHDVDSKLLQTITLSDAYAFLNYALQERQDIASTRSRKVSSLRTFFKYLTVNANILKTNPIAELEVPSSKKALPKYLNLEESLDFLSAIDGEYKERDYCIFTFFLNCGIRLSELVAINLNDIKDDTLKVLGKGNKERIVYLNDACKSALQDYLKVRPHDKAKDKNALFISRLGNRISNKTVQWSIKKYLEASGLSGKGYSVHKLRHTAATLMYQHGHVDIRILKEILGHSNLATTEIYTHVASEQLEQAADSNPLSKVKQKKK